MTICAADVTSTCPIFPMKYESTGRGVPPSRFSVPSPRSTAMSTPRFCTPLSRMPAEIMPGR